MRPALATPGRGTGAVGAAELVEIGRITRLHGVRGELKVFLHNPASTALQPGEEVVLRDPAGAERTLRVRSARPHRRFRLVRLEGIEDAAQAAPLVGSAVLLHRRQLPPPGDDEVYFVDLIGASVVTDNGDAVGTVADMLETGANDVCVVRSGEREILVPFVADVVARFDREARVLVIRPVPGLLDDRWA